MSERNMKYIISGTSPSSAISAQVGSIARFLQRFNWFTIHANLLGATGGALNVRLQRLVNADADVWSDWVAFPQLSAGAAAISYACDAGTNSSIIQVGGGSTETPAPALAAGSILGGHPGEAVRMVCTGGSGTTLGAAQTVYLSAYRLG